LLADGALAAATTPAELTVAVTFQSSLLPEGTSHSYLLAAGVPRLCVSVQRAGARARLVAIESLGDPATAPTPEQRRHP
jgi:hypothetical protein